MAQIDNRQMIELLSTYFIRRNEGGGTGPFAPTPHDLNSAHHTGTIADAQATQFIKTDGSRLLTGNQAVADGVTIDGVDISELAASIEPVTVLDSESIDFSLSGQQVTGDVLPAGVDHDLLKNYVANKHINHSLVSIIAGNGLTGGGNLTANRTLNVGAGNGIIVNVDDVALDLTYSPTWTGSHIFNNGVTINSWLTVGTQLTLNNLVEDVDVELKLKRTTGGDFSLFWNGDIAWTTKVFRPFDLIINRISDTEPATTWAGMVWLDP
jgi:hypothetical protein